MQTSKLIYITKNVDKLDIDKRREILKIIVNDLGIESVNSCADGTRLIINNIKQQTIDEIMDIITNTCLKHQI